MGVPPAGSNRRRRHEGTHPFDERELLWNRSRDSHPRSVCHLAIVHHGAMRRLRELTRGVRRPCGFSAMDENGQVYGRHGVEFSAILDRPEREGGLGLNWEQHFALALSPAAVKLGTHVCVGCVGCVGASFVGGSRHRMG